MITFIKCILNTTAHIRNANPSSKMMETGSARSLLLDFIRLPKITVLLEIHYKIHISFISLDVHMSFTFLGALLFSKKPIYNFLGITQCGKNNFVNFSSSWDSALWLFLMAIIWMKSILYRVRVLLPLKILYTNHINQWLIIFYWLHL